LSGLSAVFRRPAFLLLAAAVGTAVLVLAAWLPNLDLVWQVALSDSASLGEKLTILAALTGSLATNFTPFNAIATTTIAGLFGANIAAIAYLLRQHRRQSVLGSSTPATSSLAGLLSGIVGVGCAACGTLALSPLLSFLGAAGLTGLLPFAGGEFTLIGIALLSASLIVTAKRIARPVSCTVKEQPS
jgi:hypothetical protein